MQKNNTSIEKQIWSQDKTRVNHVKKIYVILTIYIFSIFNLGSASSRGKFTWYGERCASTMAVTYSSGDSDEPKIVNMNINYIMLWIMVPEIWVLGEMPWRNRYKINLAL